MFKVMALNYSMLHILSVKNKSAFKVSKFKTAAVVKRQNDKFHENKVLTLTVSFMKIVHIFMNLGIVLLFAGFRKT